MGRRGISSLRSEIPKPGRYVDNKKMTFDNDILKNQNVVS